MLLVLRLLLRCRERGFQARQACLRKSIDIATVTRCVSGGRLTWRLSFSSFSFSFSSTSARTASSRPHVRSFLRSRAVCAATRFCKIFSYFNYQLIVWSECSSSLPFQSPQPPFLFSTLRYNPLSLSVATLLTKERLACHVGTQQNRIDASLFRHSSARDPP